MPSRASTILGAFEKAQAELVGKAVVLADGKAGTVENVWLDELHGLRISITGHDGKWPVSTSNLRRARLMVPSVSMEQEHRSPWTICHHKVTGE
jgi:hypothetical protein